jgi:inosine-uridine nucleoside N-ribohydrolase
MCETHEKDDGLPGADSLREHWERRKDNLSNGIVAPKSRVDLSECLNDGEIEQLLLAEQQGLPAGRMNHFENCDVCQCMVDGARAGMSKGLATRKLGIMVDTNTKELILAFIDAPDPDNFVQLLALIRLNPNAELAVVLTGRPVRFGATKDHKTWEWDYQSSRMAQEASAVRARNFLKNFGVSIVKVYDGGIAPRTLVPHWVHFAEYYKFLDVDPLQAIRHSELEPQEDLVKLILSYPEASVKVAVGGPMTGLRQVIERNPEIISRFKEVHCMFATWGNVALMQFDDKPRGALQFNVACDPLSSNFILMGLDCPIYLMPTEVTRVKEIGFVNAQALREILPDNKGTRALYNLYALWYDAAVKPRQDKNPDELIFIHDVVAALSLDEPTRNAIYNVVPVSIVSAPCLPSKAEIGDWGKVEMKKRKKVNSARPRYAAVSLTEGGAAKYLETLRKICA